MDLLIFTYGSLRLYNHENLPFDPKELMQRVGVGYVMGSVYKVGEYSGLCLQPNDEKVWGEIYKVNDYYKTFAVLDEYEGCNSNYEPPWEYRRELIQITTNENKLMNAWTYLYNRDTTNLEKIL